MVLAGVKFAPMLCFLALAPGFMERSAALLTLLVVAHGLATPETSQALPMDA